MVKRWLVIVALSALTGCWFKAGPVGGGVGKANTATTAVG